MSTETRRAIWKYNVRVSDNTQILTMPAPARVLHVGCQQPGVVAVWAEVTPGSSTEVSRAFHVHGTGHGVRGVYVGTALDGEFVWHLYAEDEAAS